MNPLFYSSAIPPHIRVGQFVADEPRLAWTFKFLDQLPKAEVLLVGGSARDAVRGVLPKGLHLLIRQLPIEKLASHLNRFGEAETVNAGNLNFKPTNFETHPSLHISIPQHDYPDYQAPVSYDLGQRDFTVNAIAYSLNSGLMIDPFGGIQDINNGCLRCVGNAQRRLEASPQRSLRALRLAAEQGFQIDNQTWRAVQRALPTLNDISTTDAGTAVYAIPRANIGQEFLRTLTSNPIYGYRLWKDSGASNLFTPELSQLDAIEHGNGELGSARLQRTFGWLTQPSPTLVFALLMAHLEDLAQEAAENIITRLHLHKANSDFDYAEALWLLKHKNLLEELDPEHIPTSMFEKLFIKDYGHSLLSFLDSYHKASGHYSPTRARLHTAQARHKRLVTDITSQPKLLRGRDLQHLGLNPGPHYRAVLNKLRDAQLDGLVSDREEALHYVRNLLATKTL